MKDLEHFEPGDTLKLNVKVNVSFTQCCDIDRNELSAAISEFAYKFIKEMYVCKKS